MSNLKINCKFLDFELNSPLVFAPNPYGIEAEQLIAAARHGCGMVTAKSCSLHPRAGHPDPVTFDWGGGYINAIGLRNPGGPAYADLLRQVRPELAERGVPLLGNIFAATVEEFAQVAETIAVAEPDMIEVNISCPNVGDEYGTPFSGTPETAAAVTRVVKAAVSCPITIKLAPNVPSISRIAQAVEAAGADAITAINTMPGMVIELPSGKPVLSNRVGGISGAAIKPIALRAIYEITQRVNIPVIGTGGVVTGEDVAELLMAGATVVGVATTVYKEGPAAIERLNRELADFMTAHNFASVDAMRGLSHP